MRYLEILFPEEEIKQETLSHLLHKLKEAKVPIEIDFLFIGNQLRFFIPLPENKKLVFLQGKEAQQFEITEPPEEEQPQLSLHISSAWPLLGQRNLLELIEKKLGKENKVFLGGRVKRSLGIYSLSLWFQNPNDERVQKIFKFSLKFPYSFLSFKLLKGSPYKLSDKREETNTPEEAFQFIGEASLGKLSARTSFPTPISLNLENFDFWRHSTIVGQTGVGKSKFLELFLQKLTNSPVGQEYTTILIDPHDSIAGQLQGKVNFKKVDFQANKISLFFTQADPTLSSELSLLLFESLLGDRWNDKLKRLLRYTLFILFAQQKLEFSFLRKFLTDITTRKEVLGTFDGAVHVKDFFDTEFIEFQTQFYDITFVPILNLIEELNFIPAISSESIPTENLNELITNERLIIISLNRIKLGNVATKMLAGLTVQQIFMLAQSQTLNKKLILAIDEVPTIENKALPQLLSEARKFYLGIILSFQYINQLPEELKESLLTNIYNWFVFKTSSDDAKLVSSNIEIPLSPNFQKQAKELGFSATDIKEKILTSLNLRECMVRIYQNNKFIPAFKMKTEEVK